MIGKLDCASRGHMQSSMNAPLWVMQTHQVHCAGVDVQEAGLLHGHPRQYSAYWRKAEDRKAQDMWLSVARDVFRVHFSVSTTDLCAPSRPTAGL